MSNKVILVVLDGLEYNVGRQCMGFLQALCEQGKATLYKVQSELPSMSRPLYETILTGTVPAENGIVHNQVVRRSSQQSIFSLARQQGLTTAAAAYHWISELYNRAPYDAVRDRHTDDPELLIQHGCFYHEDHYPDSHLYLDAEWLRRRYDPDFLFVHPMNIDDAGHRSGYDSSHYRNTARHSDMALSDHLPAWLDAGYQVLVTSDHGMNNDKSHGGILPEEREVPLYVIGQAFSHQSDCTPSQVDICGVVCTLLGIKDHAKTVSDKLLALPSHNAGQY
ncbi:alkaline phosphatase family protein [Marinobacterium rhizophilum]|uniref:Alkaline phosphatase family protein n=1 Tax=Marinobacterium rhizophilum TaxID=420402 RepID=A0ABY5HJX9_9GAMM|nr:alkaline phosphatase family protein [Marinobacterium rhizophilum]UTW11567.1 alkaline phosphatase family protein [Marinobacterium rhizophilum]